MRLSFAVITVIVNGHALEVPDGATVADLVRQTSPAGSAPAAMAVELNRRVVPRREHAERALAAGDRIELVTLVGGG